VTSAEIFVEVDRLIAASPPKEIPSLVAALSARLGLAAARMMTVEPRRDDHQGAPDENLDVAEAARRLGVSTAYLYRNASKMPFALKVGRRRLFSAQGLATWAAKRRGA